MVRNLRRQARSLGLSDRSDPVRIPLPVLLYLTVSAIVPSLLLMWYFHSRDRFPEPHRVLWTTFALGVGSAVPVLLVVAMLDSLVPAPSSPGWLGLRAAFLKAAMPEELFKLAVVWLYCARHEEFDEPIDGIVYGVAASLGFATLENVLYVYEGGARVALLRALTAVPGHAFYGAVMGYHVAEARFAETGRSRALVAAYVVPTLLHGIYDFPLLAAREAGEDAGTWVLLALVLVPGTLLWSGHFAVRKSRVLQAAHDVQAALEEPRARPSRAPGVLGLVVSVPLASWGGLITLGVLGAILVGRSGDQKLMDLLVGGAIIGALPLAIGLGLFAWSLKRLNQSSA